jgi:hypothetical protein
MTNIQKTDYTEKYLTQSELARQWRVQESTIKNLRDKGHLPYFQLPGSTRILYPIAEILKIETTHLKNQGGNPTLTQPERERKNSVISTKSHKKWEI